jgi:beta-galactosidase
VEYNYASKGKELLKNRTLSKGDSMTIAPWDLLIVEE